MTISAILNQKAADIAQARGAGHGPANGYFNQFLNQFNPQQRALEAAPRHSRSGGRGPGASVGTESIARQIAGKREGHRGRGYGASGSVVRNPSGSHGDRGRALDRSRVEPGDASLRQIDRTATQQPVGQEAGDLVDHGRSQVSNQDSKQGDPGVVKPAAADAVADVVVGQAAGQQSGVVDPQVVEEEGQTNEQSPAELAGSDASRHLVVSQDQPTAGGANLVSQALVTGPTDAAGQRQVVPEQAAVSNALRLASRAAPANEFVQEADDSTGLVGRTVLDAADGDSDASGSGTNSQTAGNRALPTAASGHQQAGQAQPNFSVHLDTAAGLAPLPAAASNQQAVGVNEVLQAQVPPDQESVQNEANIARVMRGMRGVVNQNGGAVTMRLNPPEMGIVRIEMQIAGGSVNAQLHTEHESARALLTQQLGQLRQSLEQHGLTVDRLSVQTIGSDHHSFTADRDDDRSASDGRSRGRDLTGGHQGRGGREKGPRDSESQQPGASFDGVLDGVA